MQILIEIRPVVLEKKIFKFCNQLPLEKGMGIHFLFTEGCFVPSLFENEDENVKVYDNESEQFRADKLTWAFGWAKNKEDTSIKNQHLFTFI